MSFYIGDVSSDGDVVIVVSGELDHANSPRLRAHVAAAIRAGRRHLVLDFCDVSGIDSTGIGVLASAVANLNEIGGGSVAVVGVRGKVKRIFQITGLDGMISLHHSRDEAVQSLTPVG